MEKITQREKTLIRRMFISSINKDRLYRASIITCLYYKNFTFFGENKNKTDTIQNKYSDIVGKDFIHAEIDVLKKASKILDLSEIKKSTLIIIRYKLNDIHFLYGDSKPCVSCQRAIKDYEVPNLIYFENDKLVKITN